MTDLPIQFQKNSIAFSISREMALDMGIVEPTPEETKQREIDRAEWEAKVFHRKYETREFVRQLAEVADPVGRAVLDLHAMTSARMGFAECAGCDFGGYEGEPPEWPCSTITAVAQMLGIDVPDHPYMEETK